MAKNTLYRQCTLCRRLDDGSRKVTVSYIPESFARLGNALKRKRDDGTWEDGWTVESVGESSVAQTDLLDSHKAIKDHRTATGDNLPSVTESTPSEGR